MMFGYVVINKAELPAEAVKRYEAFYCGLCKTLKSRHGLTGRMTLSYDMAFLLILLTSLYEPEETSGESTCPPHPVKAKPFVRNEIFDYASDMNIALAYHKSLDNWKDERKLSGRIESGLLAKAYREVAALYPERCGVIEECLAAVDTLEQAATRDVDALANQTARMLAEVYAYRPDDLWAPVLRAIGGALGRFIYMMDAYEDLPSDRRKKQFNPLIDFEGHADYETLCHQALSMLIAECTEAFEVLPLVQDLDILRNILYSGVWMRYAAIQKQKARKKEEA